MEVTERTGVDPAFAFDTSKVVNELTRCFPQTSDAFFASERAFQAYDVIFIDGMHTFEQVVRDFSNGILRTHQRSVIILDDTVPDDVYSALPDSSATTRLRRAAGVSDLSWHGDVFKVVFYLHDFWPSLNYRTIVGSGNPQTLVWRSNQADRKPLFDSFEAISRLSYFDMLDNIGALLQSTEMEAIDLCVSELNLLKDSSAFSDVGSTQRDDRISS